MIADLFAGVATEIGIAVSLGYKRMPQKPCHDLQS